MNKNIKVWLEDARGIYAVPEYLIDDLLAGSVSDKNKDDILDTLQEVIDALDEFKYDLEVKLEEEEEEEEEEGEE